MSLDGERSGRNSGLHSRASEDLASSSLQLAAELRPPPPSPGGPRLTDVVVLDVDDELGERLELESAAPEPAGIGEERSGGDASHVFTARGGAFTGLEGGETRDGGGPEGGSRVWVVNEEASGSRGGSGAESGADTGRAGGQTGQRRDAAGRLVTVREGRGLVEGYVTMCLPVGV